MNLIRFGEVSVIKTSCGRLEKPTRSTSGKIYFSYFGTSACTAERKGELLSAFFHSVRKFLYDVRASFISPFILCARANPKWARPPIGSFETTPGQFRIF